MDEPTVPPGRQERALLVGSSGGHLTQLLALEPWWREIERGWVTFDTPDAVHALSGEAHVWWAHHPTTRNVPNLLRNTRLAWRLVREFRPTIVVSTGAAVAWPFFWPPDVLAPGRRTSRSMTGSRRRPSRGGCAVR